MRIDTGRDQLACVHLTDKPTLRWYAKCCGMPLFNSYATGKIPYITTQLAACDPETRQAIVGPSRGHLFTQDGIGDISALPKMSMATLMRRFFPRMIKDIVSGDRRRCALFDAETLQPIAKPHRLTVEERETLRQGKAAAYNHRHPRESGDPGRDQPTHALGPRFRGDDEDRTE